MVFENKDDDEIDDIFIDVVESGVKTFMRPKGVTKINIKLLNLIIESQEMLDLYSNLEIDSPNNLKNLLVVGTPWP